MEMRMRYKNIFSIIEENLINDGFFFNNTYFKYTRRKLNYIVILTQQMESSLLKNYINFKRLHLLITKK